MAVILTEDEETKDPTAPTSDILSTGAGATGGQATTSPAATPATQARPQGSGRFTNLQKYLGANQQAGGQLGAGIEQKGGEYMGKVREGIESAQGVERGIAGERQRIGQAGQFAQQIEADPVAVAQGNLQDVTQLRLGQHQGTQLQGQGQQARGALQAGIDPLQRFGENLGTEAGRFDVLQDVYGGAYKPTYGTGQRRLDQLFLQAGDQGQLGQLQQQIGQTVGEGGQSLSSLQRGLGSGIRDIRGGAQQAQQQIGGAIGDFTADDRGALGSLYGDLSAEQETRKGELQENLERARSQFGAGRMGQDVADMLGLTGGTQYGVMDLQDYAGRNIGLGDTDVRMADVLDRGDYEARLGALSQLAGTDIADYTGTEDFGIKEGSDIGFDAGAFTGEAGRHMADYEDEVFGKSVYDALGMYDPYSGEQYAPDHERYANIEEERRGQTIEDLMAGYAPSIGERQGDLRGPGWGAEQAEDVTSREQIQNALEYVQGLQAGGRMYQQPDINKFTKLLEYLDKSRGQRMIVDPTIPSDLESGGQFNVT